MFKICLLLISVMVGGFLFPANLFAHKKIDLSAFTYFKESNSWLISENAAGLSYLNNDGLSVFETFAQKSNGGFVNYYQSNNSFTYGGLSESFFRLNQRTVFYGKVGYSSFVEKNMGGSASIDPYYNPMNFIEYADSTAGKKQGETYQLKGAMGTQLSERLLMGLALDYKTESYYKTRDLRHVNDLLDMKLTAGLIYKFGKLADFGLNYYYRRSIEEIVFRSAGNTDQQFNTLISLGSFMGRQERFSLYGYTGAGNKKPYFNQFQGITLQLGLLPQNKVRLYNQAGIKFRTGYFGVRSSTSVVYTEHAANVFHYNGQLIIERNALEHMLSLGFEHEGLSNFENAFRSETTAGVLNTTVYYGQNKVLSRTMNMATFNYTLNWDASNGVPIRAFKLGGYWKGMSQNTVLYPAYRKQLINQYNASLLYKRNIFKGKHLYGMAIGFVYGSGGGVINDDGKYGGQSGSQSSAQTLDRYLLREFEYLTGSRMEGNIGFRYSRQIKATKTKVYAEMEYCVTKAFLISAIGNQFHVFSLKLGYAF